MTISGYDWRQDERTGKWRLWEFETPRPLDNWYREAVNGRGRLVRDQDGQLLPGFSSMDDGNVWLRQFRWGRRILGEGEP